MQIYGSKFVVIRNIIVLALIVFTAVVIEVVVQY